jgi:hypothetical protein
MDDVVRDAGMLWQLCEEWFEQRTCAHLSLKCFVGWRGCLCDGQFPKDSRFNIVRMRRR